MRMEGDEPDHHAMLTRSELEDPTVMSVYQSSGRKWKWRAVIDRSKSLISLHSFISLAECGSSGPYQFSDLGQEKLGV